MSDEKRVIARSSSSPIRTYNKNGEVETMGNIHSWVYQGEDTESHEYRVSDYVEPYSLKPTNGEPGFVEPVQIFDYMKDFPDWEINRVSYGRSGLSTVIEFYNPSGGIPDPIGWDVGNIWQDNERKLSDLVQIKINSKPGGGIQCSRGVYRLVCSNGLMAQSWGLGKFSIRGHNLSNMNFNESFIEMLENPLGDLQYVRAGKVKGLRAFNDLLISSEAGEDISIPNVLTRPWASIKKTPAWFKEHFVENLTACLSSKRSDDVVYGLDIANMVTSPISMEALKPEDERNNLFRVANSVQPMVQAVSDLVGVLSL